MAATSDDGKAANGVTRPSAALDMTQFEAPTELTKFWTSAWKPAPRPVIARATASTRPTPMTAMRNWRARYLRSANVTASMQPPLPCALSWTCWRDSNHTGVVVRVHQQPPRPDGPAGSAGEGSEANEQGLQQQRLVRVARQRLGHLGDEPDCLRRSERVPVAGGDRAGRGRVGHPAPVGPGQHAQARPQRIGPEAAFVALV